MAGDMIGILETAGILREVTGRTIHCVYATRDLAARFNQRGRFGANKHLYDGRMSQKFLGTDKDRVDKHPND